MGKYVVKSGGTSFAEKETVLYYLPLTENLDDLSTFNRNTVYEGDTELTITTADGLYLYKNLLVLDNSFLDDIENDYFSISFDIKINNTGTTENSSTRYIMTFNTDYLLQIVSNAVELRSIKESGNNNIFSTINDTLWHHIVLYIDRKTKDVFISFDGSDIASVLILTDYNNFVIGNSTYGLNGCIKELKICTGYSKKYVRYFKDGVILRSLGLYYGDTTWSYVSTSLESTLIYKGTPLNKYIKITSTENSIKGISFYVNQLENTTTYLHICVSGEINFDMAYIYIDDVLRETRTGDTATFKIKLSMQSGFHKISVTYRKDRSSSSGSDCIWLYSLVQYRQERINLPIEDKLPYHRNIVGWFDNTTLNTDLSLWENKIDLQASIKVNNTVSIEDRSIKAIGGDFEDLICFEPKTIYLICKLSAVTEEGCLIGLKRKNQTDYTDFSIFETTSLNFRISQLGNKDILVAKTITDYCCIAIVRVSGINSSNENGILVFVDGMLAGVLNGNIYGNYNNAITLLRSYDASSNSYTNLLNSPVFIKTLICSTSEHCVSEVVENSLYLMKKYI